MRVFVAGASGAIGKPLVQQLLAAGHEVTGITRRQERAEEIRAAGADAVVCDVFNRAALHAAVLAREPDVVINELTAFPERYDLRKASFYEGSNRVRGEGGRNLVAAARAAGVRRFITESVAFIYAPEGEWLQDEEGRPFEDAPGHFGPSVRVLLGHEREVLESGDLEGLVLRYGQLYGPGTYYAPGGSIAQQVSRRLVPIIGRGTGINSFIHVQDAAAATVAALDHGLPGIYNITDDEPAPMNEWLPAYAEALGAKPPWRAPAWLVRLVAGRVITEIGTGWRGASNAKAKRELGWQPRYPSWRRGFREALG